MLPPLPTETVQKTSNKDIQDFLNLLDDGRIIVNNKYQRGEVGQYKPAFRTRLVESIVGDENERRSRRTY